MAGKLAAAGARRLPLFVFALLTVQPQQLEAQRVPDGAVPALFETADRCVACHNQLTSPSGEDVSIGLDWRASMMANSARDPYWQAAVRREIMDHPESSAAIEDKCSTCHMPMMRYEKVAAGSVGAVFEHLPVVDVAGTAATDDRLAADGVSCTTCHQIGEEGLGTERSFGGGFHVDTSAVWGSRRIFGPFVVDAGRTAIMQSASRFHPAQATHLQRSEMCATCHTLFTHSLGPGGEITGELPEQVPYLEWRHSAFAEEASCQSCHMPLVADSVPMSSVLGQPRSGFRRHVFRGGNFFMLRMLNRYRDELGVRALPQELELAAERTVAHLQADAARVVIERASFEEGRLVVDVAVANLAGHKLPTAYPSRRAWLHVSVKDGQGIVVFESGAFRPDGSIAGNENDLDPSGYEPHHTQISAAEDVQVYEAIMADPGGRPTTGLLTGVRYAKDNRLLPRGFDKHAADASIAVHGDAATDPDFTAAGDLVRYSIAVDAATGPFEVDVELWYQPIGYRWALNLRDYEAPETERFVRYYEEMAAGSAIVLSRAGAAVGP